LFGILLWTKKAGKGYSTPEEFKPSDLLDQIVLPELEDHLTNIAKDAIEEALEQLKKVYGLTDEFLESLDGAPGVSGEMELSTNLSHDLLAIVKKAVDEDS
jgi:hypothetical protein